MTKEEIISNLNDCYKLRSGLEKRNLQIPEDLVKEISRYEVLFRIATLRMHDYHCTVEPNDRTFYDSLVEYSPEDNDEKWPISICGAWIASAVVIKHGDKYGVFHVPGYNPNWDEPKLMSLVTPFVYEDVKFARDLSDKYDIAIVAVKKDGKWGVIDMHSLYCYQTIVPIEYENLYDLAYQVENVTGIVFEGGWEDFETERTSESLPSSMQDAPVEPQVSPLADIGIVLLTKDNAKKAEGRELRVTMPDGTIYQEPKAIQTFIKVLQHIGLDRIPQVGITCKGYNLVDKRQRTDGKNKWQQEVDGKWVYIYFSNSQKVIFLHQIADYLNIKLRIEAV